MQSYSDSSHDPGYYDQQPEQQQMHEPRLTLPPASSFFDHSPRSNEFHGGMEAGPSTSSGYANHNDYGSGSFSVDPFLAGPSPGYLGHDPFGFHDSHGSGYGAPSGSMDLGYPHSQNDMEMMNMSFDNQMMYQNDYIGSSSSEKNPSSLGGSSMQAGQYDPYGVDMYQSTYHQQPPIDGSGSSNPFVTSPVEQHSMFPGSVSSMGGYPMASDGLGYQSMTDMSAPFLDMQQQQQATPQVQQLAPQPPPQQTSTPQTVPSTPVNESPKNSDPPSQSSGPIETPKSVDTTIAATVAEVVAQQTALIQKETETKTSKNKRRRTVKSFESIVENMLPQSDSTEGPTVKQHLQKQQMEKRAKEQADRRAKKAKLDEEKHAAAVAEAVALGKPPPLSAPKRNRKKKAPLPDPIPVQEEVEVHEVINLDMSDEIQILEPMMPIAPVIEVPLQLQPQEIVLDDEPMVEQPVFVDPPPSEPPVPKPKPKRVRKPAVKRETKAQKKQRLDFLYKAHHMQNTVRSLVLKNTALVDEVSRLFYRIQTATEERKRLAKRLQHFERNRMRRLQTQKRKQAAAMAVAPPSEQEFQYYGDVGCQEPGPPEAFFPVEDYVDTEMQPSPLPSPQIVQRGFPFDAFEPMEMNVMFRTLQIPGVETNDLYDQPFIGSFASDNEMPQNVESEIVEKAVESPRKRVRKPRPPKDPNVTPKKRQRTAKKSVVLAKKTGVAVGNGDEGNIDEKSATTEADSTGSAVYYAAKTDVANLQNLSNGSEKNAEVSVPKKPTKTVSVKKTPVEINVSEAPRGNALSTNESLVESNETVATSILD